ncbi:MAG: nucleoside deaminase [Proteobacteria bacterium]|nr:nucleoside deaminase [Burkholderiales bacterium]
MTMALDHLHFMGIALELSHEAQRQGNRPLGALIVAADGEILAQGGNEVYSEFDPTAHGEIVVIRRAARRRQSVDLSGCTLYTAMEPCPMCCWAILEANVSHLVLGGRHAGIGRRDLGDYSVEAMLKFTGRQIDLVTGVRTDECESMRLAWIAARAARGLGPR